jgi:flagellin
MSLSIRTQAGVNHAQRHIASHHRGVNASVQRLSSGLRVSSSADDAAAMAQTETMRADKLSMGRAERNANEAISMLQTAEAGMASIGDAYVRMRELAVQAASDGITDDERGHLDVEYQELKETIEQIAGSIEYNGQSLLAGTGGGAGGIVDSDGDAASQFFFQIGFQNSADDQLEVQIKTQVITQIQASDISTRGDAQAAIDAIDLTLNASNCRLRSDPGPDVRDGHRRPARCRCGLREHGVHEEPGASERWYRDARPGQHPVQHHPSPLGLAIRVLDGSVHLALGVSRLEILALVVVLLALSEADLDLDSPVLQIDLQRHGRESLLVHLGRDPQGLILVDEQLTAPPWLVIVPIGEGVFMDVHIHEEELALVDVHVPIRERDPALPQRLHLGSDQNDARLPGLLDGVVMPRLLVLSDHAVVLRAGSAAHDAAFQVAEAGRRPGAWSDRAWPVGGTISTPIGPLCTISL